MQAWALNVAGPEGTIPIKRAGERVYASRDQVVRLNGSATKRMSSGCWSRGGVERWLKLTEGLGLDSAYVESTEGILPATRFAVDAYVHYVRDEAPLEAIASSLTELFAPGSMRSASRECWRITTSSTLVTAGRLTR